MTTPTPPTPTSRRAGPGRAPALVAAAGALLALGPAALAQSATVRPSSTGFDPISGHTYEMFWHTVDGGGRTFLTGGIGPGFYELGTTAGQPDTGFSHGDCFEWNSGFWVSPAPPTTCYPNCDHSIVQPILNVQDFSCFLSHYAAGSCYANCDDSTQAPILNVQDFSCFLTKYAAGCP